MPRRNRAIPSHQHRLTAYEMKRGIYIDFEGLTSKSPALLGILCEDKFEQVVLQKELASTANEDLHLRFEEVTTLLPKLYQKAIQQKRVIIAFTQHEWRISKQYAGVDLSNIYKDARKLAKHWKNQHLKLDDSSIRSLKDYVKLLGLEYPEDMVKQVARRLRKVGKSIRKHEEFSKCPQRVKEEWSKLLEYNRLDCYWMRDLVSTTVDSKLSAKKQAQSRTTKNSESKKVSTTELTAWDSNKYKEKNQSRIAKDFREATTGEIVHGKNWSAITEPMSLKSIKNNQQTKDPTSQQSNAKARSHIPEELGKNQLKEMSFEEKQSKALQILNSSWRYKKNQEIHGNMVPCRVRIWDESIQSHVWDTVMRRRGNAS